MYRIARWLARRVYDLYAPLADQEEECNLELMSDDDFCWNAREFAMRVIQQCNLRDPKFPR